MTTDEILDHLELLFPNAKPELNYRNPFELLIAVILSAQTTDIRVNLVTKELFTHYPDVHALAAASLTDVETIIKSIGLYHNKAKNIIACSQQLERDFAGIVPNNLRDLQTLPGVGRKTANVVVSVAFGISAIAVDTHVERVAKRLCLAAEQASVLEVEQSLMRKIKKTRWSRAHHLFIFFGRYQCHSQKPECEGCPFVAFCRYQKQLKKR